MKKKVHKTLFATELVKKAEEFLQEFFKKHFSDDFTYHNFTHAVDCKKYVTEISLFYDFNVSKIEILQLAALFHDCGYYKTYHGHEEESKIIAQKFLSENGATPLMIDEVVELIDSTEHTKPADTLEKKILHDADYMHIATSSFDVKSEGLRLEWEKIMDKTYNEEEWISQQQSFLLNKNFQTSYAILTYSEKKDKNFIKLSKKREKAEKPLKRSRGIETVYRAVYRNHINLSAIADDKANMMISINTIIMSIVIAGIGSGFTFTGRDFIEHIRFTIPMSILLITAMLSMIFAILSASPTVTSKNVSKSELKKKKVSALFFGNFLKMGLKRFTESLMKMREEDTVAYDNMSIDLFFLGEVLQKKYIKLKASYMCFLFGLCLTVIVFLGILFWST